MANGIAQFVTAHRRLTVAVGVAAMALVATGSSVWWSWMKDGAKVGRAHAAHQVSHPGWSFPARVYSPAVPLTVAPRRLVAEARLRGYLEDCGKRPAPGTFCDRPPRVVPRSGAALEPVLIGELLGPDAELREHLPLADAPKHLLDAIEVAEDRDFRNHSGVNLRAMVRALIADALSRGYSQGGSTLTMQVVRGLTQRSEKTVLRKLREMAMAMGLERALGKDAVMQMYLDAPYLGQRGSVSICGFQAAARHYFGKDARSLDLAEAATLVAILPGAGKLAPDRNPEACRARRDRILEGLGAQRGYDVQAALKEPLELTASAPPVERFPSYLSATRAKLEAELPLDVVYGAGLVVETGLDLVAQSEAEKIFPARLKYYEGLVGKRKDHPLQAAGVVLDVETGLIRAVYGGTDLTSTGFNRATQAHRQPGSSFKPVVYALAMSRRRPDGSPAFTAATAEPNTYREFKTPQGTWRPTNIGSEYTPSASLAYGLAWSQNLATASLLEQLGGPEPLITFARTLGFDTHAWPHEMGLALGQAEVVPLEMAQLSAVVANGGRRVLGTPIFRAVDAAGVERLRPPVAGEQVLTPEAAALTRELMRLVIDYGTGGAIRGAGGEPGYAGPAIGKTGTTDAEKDLWFIGATPTRAEAVWLGYDEPARIGAAAADLSAPLWGWWMRAMTQYEPSPAPDFAGPKLVRVPICTETGLLPGPSCKVIVGSFLAGTAPRDPCLVDHPPPEARETPEAVYESIWKKVEREKSQAAPDGGP